LFAQRYSHLFSSGSSRSKIFCDAIVIFPIRAFSASSASGGGISSSAKADIAAKPFHVMQTMIPKTSGRIGGEERFR
jgi:hypothetical protein